MARRVHWVLVLGDFGRSPRMQYHTLSLSKQPDTDVHVIAYAGSAPLPELQQSRNVHLHAVPEPPALLRRMPRLIYLVLKVLHQLAWLLWMMLASLPSPCHILLQNPPAIPTMAVCWLAAKRHRAQLVIDWHNYGYTILALTQGARHPLVRLARSYERFWGRRGTSHFCVTRAMRDDLRLKWGIAATVLYDRPPAFFGRTPLPAVHTLFRKLGAALEQPAADDFLARRSSQAAAGRLQEAAEVTVLTSKRSGGQAVALRADRPAVVVSSTSWTPDEDFSMLLDAAVQYDMLASGASNAGGGAGSTPGTPTTPNTLGGAAGTGGAGGGRDPSDLPDLLLLITGKGPQKEMYLSRIAAMSFRRVAIRALWLEAADYPLLLGAADVGVCLHASSSGLDLPMKVVDMYGSGLPVCALSYSCIRELVAPGETGLLFSSGAELAAQLAALLAGFPARPSAQLAELQRNVAAREQGLRWEENWQHVAAPVLGYC